MKKEAEGRSLNNRTRSPPANHHRMATSMTPRTLALQIDLALPLADE